MREKLRKAGRIMLHFTRSISTKIMLIILVLVLPLNVLAITLSHVSINAMTEQARLSMGSVMENYMTELHNRMMDTGYLLWNMKNEDPDAWILSKQEDTDEYLAARVRFYYKLQRNMQLADGSDGYFFYMKKRKDILVWDIEGKNKTDAEEFVREQIRNGITQGWSMHTVNGRQAFCMFIQIHEVVYGGWIYLDSIVEQLEQDIQYEQVQLYFDSRTLSWYFPSLARSA